MRSPSRETKNSRYGRPFCIGSRAGYCLPSCDWFSRWVDTAFPPAIGSHAEYFCERGARPALARIRPVRRSAPLSPSSNRASVPRGEIRLAHPCASLVDSTITREQGVWPAAVARSAAAPPSTTPVRGTPLPAGGRRRRTPPGPAKGGPQGGQEGIEGPRVEGPHRWRSEEGSKGVRSGSRGLRRSYGRGPRTVITAGSRGGPEGKYRASVDAKLASEPDQK
eukprot:1186311-Prorocentrum_minimum.AAC.1